MFSHPRKNHFVNKKECTYGRSSDSFRIFRHLPVTRVTVAIIVGSFMKLTAAGLFGIFTRFPFERAMRTVLRCKIMKIFDNHQLF